MTDKLTDMIKLSKMSDSTVHHWQIIYMHSHSIIQNKTASIDQCKYKRMSHLTTNQLSERKAVHCTTATYRT